MASSWPPLGRPQNAPCAFGRALAARRAIKAIYAPARLLEALATDRAPITIGESATLPPPRRFAQYRQAGSVRCGGKFSPDEFDADKATKAMQEGLPDWRTMNEA
jgi:hypothetical protein